MDMHMKLDLDLGEEQKILSVIADIETKEQMLKFLEYMKKKNLNPSYFSTALNKLALLENETN